jgi:DNA repair protein RadD
MDAYPKARILGVTATPIRGDGQGLGIMGGGIFDTMVMGPTVQELIDLGYLVRPRVFGPANKIDLSSLHTKMGDYDKQEVYDLMNKPTITGDAVDQYRRRAHGLPCVVFCTRVAHAQDVAEAFRQAGYKAESVDGTMDDFDRKRILDGLGDGSMDVVTSVDIISEGTDIPAIGAIICLRPTQSKGLYIQQVGRALRPVKGKGEAIVLDQVGNVSAHGLVTQDMEWSLEGEKKQRGKKKADPDEERVTQCEACFAFYEPTPICPYCGHVHKPKKHEIKQVEGDLVEITEMDVRQRKMEEARAQTLKELQEIGKERGYKPGWAYHRWKARQQKGA